MDAAIAQDGARAKSVVQVLACVLERLVSANNKLQDSGMITKFHALRPPGISIHSYLDRIHKYASCSTECFVLSLVYIDRLIQRNNFILNSLNVHRIIITSVMLAAKFFDDQYFNNAYYAKVGGVPCGEMNSLELEFLFLINFTLHVTHDAYQKYYRELVSHCNYSSPLKICPCGSDAIRNSIECPPYIPGYVPSSFTTLTLKYTQEGPFLSDPNNGRHSTSETEQEAGQDVGGPTDHQQHGDQARMPLGVSA